MTEKIITPRSPPLSLGLGLYGEYYNDKIWRFTYHNLNHPVATVCPKCDIKIFWHYRPTCSQCLLEFLVFMLVISC